MLWAMKSSRRDELEEVNKDDIGLKANVAAAMSVRALSLTAWAAASA
jgi:hypothetical protein